MFLLTPLLAVAVISINSFEEYKNIRTQLHLHPPIYALGNSTKITLADGSTARIEIKNPYNLAMPTLINAPKNSKFIGNISDNSELLITIDGKVVNSLHLHNLELKNRRTTVWVPLTKGNPNSYQALIITTLFNQDPTRYKLHIKSENQNRYFAFAPHTLNIEAGSIQTFPSNIGAPANKEEKL